MKVKDLSPSVALDMKLGELSKRSSFEFLRLYRDGHQREIRDDKLLVCYFQRICM